MAANSAKKPAVDAAGAPDRFWEMRMWEGMCVSGWLRELARNRFHVAPRRVGMAAIITAVGSINASLWLMQKLFYGRKIAAAEIAPAPLFVIGHWRSGTTLLHELFVSDPRHGYPDTFASFAPNHFLFSRRLLLWWLRVLIPSQRPMDNMRVGVDSPQEDEWALCNMGIPSPYLTLMFPNHPPAYPEYLDLRNVPPADLDRWKAGLSWYLKCLTVAQPGRRIVLKTPQHTCRIRVLLQMFPEARFMHIVRDPYVVFPSTIKLWKKLYRYQGLQVPRFEGLEEHVLNTFNRMYDAFEEDRKLIPPSQFHEVHYEDLVKDPLAQMRTAYERLHLGDFEPACPGVQQYVERTRNYRVGRHELSPELRAQISDRWASFIARYGYGDGTPQGDA
jgi:omega-hydroxy-beta-dihydromenaquinone-9 sulfotransferase